MFQVPYADQFNEVISQCLCRLKRSPHVKVLMSRSRPLAFGDREQHPGCPFSNERPCHQVTLLLTFNTGITAAPGNDHLWILYITSLLPASVTVPLGPANSCGLVLGMLSGGILRKALCQAAHTECCYRFHCICNVLIKLHDPNCCARAAFDEKVFQRKEDSA